MCNEIVPLLNFQIIKCVRQTFFESLLEPNYRSVLFMFRCQSALRRRCKKMEANQGKDHRHEKEKTRARTRGRQVEHLAQSHIHPTILEISSPTGQGHHSVPFNATTTDLLVNRYDRLSWTIGVVPKLWTRWSFLLFSPWTAVGRAFP